MSLTSRVAACMALVAVTVTGCTDAADPGDDREVGTAARSYAATRHPIVLMPGLLGFEDLLGVVEYFPAIPEALAAGGADVYVVYGSQVNSSRVRAHQIIPQLEDIVAATGTGKVNLFAHSQGTIDARIIAAERPDLVASVTSIGGPHQGAPLADKVLDGSLTPLAGPLLGATGNLFTMLAGSTRPNDVDAAMHALSTAGMAQFNQQYPAGVPTSPCGSGAEEVGGIRYYSWSGVGSLTNPLDLLDPAWLLGSAITGGRNDGLIPVCSSHLGKVLRDDYPQNHLDEVNMLFGLVMPLGPKPVAIFRAHANRLRNEGL